MSHRSLKKQSDHDLTIQYACTDKTSLPTQSQIKQWFCTTTKIVHDHIEKQYPVIATIRIVEQEEGRQLNTLFRGKDYATNVLTFPYSAAPIFLEAHPESTALSLPLSDWILEGDIVICASVVTKEAAEQNKPILDHWAHLVVHGTLHLHGFDHETSPEDATEMEKLESKTLCELGYPDPYL